MNGLTKSFGDRTLFANLEAIIERGDRVGFVGPNGAGKTTLFRMINGLEKPDGGEIKVGETVQMSFAGVVTISESGVPMVANASADLHAIDCDSGASDGYTGGGGVCRGLVIGRKYSVAACVEDDAGRYGIDARTTGTHVERK